MYLLTVSIREQVERYGSPDDLLHVAADDGDLGAEPEPDPDAGGILGVANLGINYYYLQILFVYLY